MKRGVLDISGGHLHRKKVKLDIAAAKKQYDGVIFETLKTVFKLQKFRAPQYGTFDNNFKM